MSDNTQNNQSLVNHIKNQARKIKKSTGMAHFEALNESAKNAGFKDYQAFLKSLGADKEAQKNE
jgi:predicted N-acyltransferase